MRVATPSRLWARAAPALLLLLGACTSAPVNVSPLPPAAYQVLGKAEGKGCGFLGLLGTATNVVPMGLNGRVESAYQEAVKSVPGATALINVSITEDWAWMVFATQRCTTVRGDAIKEQT
jgi:hypothetical protein